MPFDSYKPVFTRRFTRASSHKLEVAAAVLTTYPITMACWFNSDDVTNSQDIMVLRDGIAGQWRLNLGGNAGGDPIRVVVDNTALGSTSTGYSANRWHHACGIFTANNDRAVYIDGGSKGTSAVGDDIGATPNTTTLGASSTNYFSGQMAWPAIWSATLTDAEVYQLSLGAHPLTVRPEKLVAFWDWSGGDTEFGLRATWPAVNTGSVPINGPGFLRTKIPRPWMLGAGYITGGVTASPFFYNRYVLARSR